MNAPPLSLFLVRHGQTEWSNSGRHTGRTDIPLTAKGEHEAAVLQPHLTKINFDRVFTSPMQRARQTCALAGLGATAQTEPDLSEWDYGDYEGLTSADIHNVQPGWAVFTDGCPGGETPEQISVRADRLLARLMGLRGNVALFSHGHFSMALAARWIGLPVVAGQHFLLGTASVNILGTNPAHPDIRVIALWNATPDFLMGRS